MSDAGVVAPYRSRSSLFFERYAGAEDENGRLRGILFVLGGICLVLTLVLGVVAARPRPIYYIPGVPVSGMAYPDEVPLPAAGNFAAAWLMNWMTYTPATIDGVYDRALKRMSPLLLSKVHARAAGEVARVKDERLSSVLFLEGEPEVSRRSLGLIVVLRGERGVFVGKEEMSRERVVYTVHISKHPVSEENPYGLVVADIEEGAHEHVAP